VPSTVPPTPGARVVRALEKAGFTVVRIKGSHCFMRHSDGRRAVVVPVHAGDDVPRGTMRQILASAELTPDEFRALL